MTHKIWCNLLVIVGSFLILPVVVKGGYDKENNYDDNYDIKGNKDMEKADYDDINEKDQDFHGNDDDYNYDSGDLKETNGRFQYISRRKTNSERRIHHLEKQNHIQQNILQKLETKIQVLEQKNMGHSIDWLIKWQCRRHCPLPSSMNDDRHYQGYYICNLQTCKDVVCKDQGFYTRNPAHNYKANMLPGYCNKPASKLGQ